MSRILFVAAIHHPEALREAAAKAMALPPGAPAPLFPPSMAQHFWEKALRKRGHILDVFYRNLPAMGTRERQTRRHAQGITPMKLAQAAWNRIPPRANPDIRLRNRNLIEHARRFAPDILWMVGDNTVIYPETLATIRSQTRCLLVYACGTSPIVFSHAIDREAARLYDLVLASDYYHGVQWLELGAPKMACLPLSACDPDFHRPYPLSAGEGKKLACDVTFVGTLVPDTLYSRRTRALEALREFDLGIWSVHDVPPSLRAHLRGKALGEAMERILSAGKICFNTHGDFVHYGGNLRLFEVAGAGVFQITDDLPGTRAWFPDTPDGKTIATYTDASDLREKVAYYLAHDDEREAIAARAQAHVYAHHTYDHRVLQFEALMGEG